MGRTREMTMMVLVMVGKDDNDVHADDMLVMMVVFYVKGGRGGEMRRREWEEQGS